MTKGKNYQRYSDPSHRMLAKPIVKTPTFCFIKDKKQK